MKMNCSKCHKKIGTFSKKFYIYPAKKRGDLEITDEKVMCKECFKKDIPEETKEDEERTIKIVALFVGEKYKEALKEIEEHPAKLKPSYWYSKGNILGNMGKFKESMKCYDEALFLDTHYIKAWYRKGTRLINKKNKPLTEKKYKDSIKCFDNVIELEKNKKLKYPRDNWYLSAKFRRMLCLVLFKEFLMAKKKNTKEVDRKTLNAINEIYPCFKTALVIGKDDKGNEISAEFNFATDDLFEFVDNCFTNKNEILEAIEPNVVAEFKQLGKRH